MPPRRAPRPPSPPPPPAASPIDGASPVYAASLAQIEEARARIAPHATVTPVMTCGSLDALMRPEHLLGEALETPDDESVSLFLKCETFQKGGAFKFRGAINAVLSLDAAERERGVVTHSSGNHAGALALAARTVGVPAYIVVPHGAPACKLAAIEAYGGKITRCEPTVSARERCAESLRRETGATLVPPYNHGPVICGQGTIGAEFLEQVPDLDAVIVPVSGGGMLAGIATAVKAIKPTCAVLAAEPEGLYGNGADCAWAWAAGEPAPATMPPPETVCDGLRAKLGDLTWPIVRDKVDGVLVVTEREVVEAMRLLFERAKLVVEPSGAAGVAAALGPAFRAWNRAAPKWGRTLRARAVGVVLCGGNVDLQALWSTYGLE